MEGLELLKSRPELEYGRHEDVTICGVEGPLPGKRTRRGTVQLRGWFLDVEDGSAPLFAWEQGIFFELSAPVAERRTPEDGLVPPPSSGYRLIARTRGSTESGDADPDLETGVYLRAAVALRRMLEAEGHR